MDPNGLIAKTNHINAEQLQLIEEGMSFKERLAAFRKKLWVGKTVRIYPRVGDRNIDCKMRDAKIVGIYKDYAHVRDKKGVSYGVLYMDLMAWGNT